MSPQTSRRHDGAGPTASGAHVGPSGRRDSSIDVLRGWFIVSMTLAHLSYGSVAERLTHAAIWLDGAIGFVTLSGLVLGMVYRRTWDRTGRVPYRKVLRRARLLYVIQVATLVLALLVAVPATRTLSVAEPEVTGGWARTLVLVATLRMPAPNLDVLAMYVVLLLAAVPALALLARGRAALLVGVAIAVWAVGTLRPDLTVPDGHVFNWVAWQLPFVIGLVVGWSWDERGLAARLRSRRSVLLAGMVTGVCFVVAQLFGRLGVLDGTAVDSAVDAAFGKWDMRPAHLVFGLAAMVVGYALVSTLADAGRLRALRTWLAVLGSRSLDAFVILCLAVIVLPAAVPFEPSSVTAMALVALTLAVQTGWVVLRRAGYLPGLATGTEVPGRPLPRRRPARRSSVAR